MSTLNRRNFLKALGLGSAATATACSDSSLRWDPMVPIENVLPYVVAPENIIPGLSTWYATQCTQCSAGCGVIARTREGRVVKLEGNPRHPANLGKLCSRGQTGLQEPYSPDRYDGPQKGDQALDWTTAVKTVADAVQSARSGGKDIVWLGHYRTGASAALVEQFAQASGAKVHFWEPLGDDALRAAAKAVFGRDTAPTYRLAEAHTIVSFGADFLHTFGNTVQHSLGWADSRDPSVGDFVSRFVAIEPRAGATSALSDLHLRVKPGTETGVAMALAKLVAEARKYNGPASGLVSGVNVKEAADAAGISEEKLKEVAGWMAEHTSAVMPGGTTTSGNPTDLAIATLILNEVAGNIGKTVVFDPADARTVARSSYQDVENLLKDCANGKVGVLFVDGPDLAYTFPSGVDVNAALSAAGTLVYFTNEPNDSITAQTLVLPPGTGLERWGDSETEAGVHTIQQPTMRPLKDTRSAEDVLLAVSKALGLKVEIAVAAPVDGEEAAEPAAVELEEESEETEVADAMPAANLDADSFKDYLTRWWYSEVFQPSGSTDTFGRFWTDTLQNGGQFAPAEKVGANVRLASAPSTAAATMTGGGDLDLLLFPHIRLLDGRHANRPWAQEISDGLTQFTWGTWIEVSPATAEKQGLQKDKNAILKTDAGEIPVGWFASPGMRDDAVAVVMGNGHASSGRYASYGSNPMKLIAAKADDKSGAMILTSTRASVSPGNERNTASTAGAIDTQNRPSINHVVSIDDLGTGKGPGSIVPMHHPPIDQRVIDQLPSVDMFPEPDHPTYRFAMAIDLNRCTGCGACQTACYAENNSAIVGPEEIRLGRSMGWIRLSRYWEGEGEHPDVRFQPVMCQHCSHAPCEGVCPVLATYHNLDGLNAMIYNRCVGTRYCGNNCPWSARRFNYHTYRWPDSFNMMLNPDVLTREMGVMEKCTFCIQRIRDVKDTWRDVNKQGKAPDQALHKLTACAQTCPADAITFGNLKDEDGLVARKFDNERAYTMLGELNAKPGVRYLARINHIASELHHGHGGGHGDEHGAAGDHHEDAAHGKAEGGDHKNDEHGAESSGGHH